MFVYFHWSKTGGQHVQAFHKADKAAEYVIGQIESLAIDEGRNLGLHAKKKAARPYGNLAEDDMADEVFPNPHQNAPVAAAAPVQAIDWGHWDPQPIAVQDQPVVMLGAKKEAKETKKIPLELMKLRDHMEIAKKDKSFENALKAIQLYEDFLKYGLSMPSESSIHTLTDLKVVE